MTVTAGGFLFLNVCFTCLWTSTLRLRSCHFHCGTHPDIDHPRWDAGLLQTLRPYRGQFDREAWNRVIQCVDACAEHVKTAPAVDRRLINSLWGICYYARLWALEPDGMLRRNNLISEEDQATLTEWLDKLSERITVMLDGGCEPEEIA